MIEGKVGDKKLSFAQAPKGKSGETSVQFEDGRTWKVKWTRDDQGLWIETPNGYQGFDVRKTFSDEGLAQYSLLGRMDNCFVSNASFLKAGEESSSSLSKTKKSAKVKSQMPGKILRISVKAGDTVKKGQSIIVMEAMKMENEIKSPQDGEIKEVKVKEGQAVETGAELLSFS